MLLHRDGLIELKYDVTTDVLRVKWPDSSSFSISELGHSLSTLIDTLKHYDIKRLLVDSRGISTEVAAADHTALALKFVQDLTTTRLQKMARLMNHDPELEERSERISQEVSARVHLPFAVETFHDERSALVWLQSA